MPKEVSQKLFRDTIPIFCPRLIRLCAFGKFIRGRDSDAISVLLRRTRARAIFQVCTIRPYAGWFLIQEAKAAVVKTIRCQSFHTRQVSHCTKVRVLDVPLDRVEILDDFQHSLDVLTVFLTNIVEFLPGLIFAVRSYVRGLELGIHLTLGRRPDDVEVCARVLFIVKIEDIAHVGRLELLENVQAYHLVSCLFEHFADAARPFEQNGNIWGWPRATRGQHLN